MCCLHCCCSLLDLPNVIISYRSLVSFARFFIISVSVTLENLESDSGVWINLSDIVSDTVSKRMLVSLCSVFSVL